MKMEKAEKKEVNTTCWNRGANVHWKHFSEKTQPLQRLMVVPLPAEVDGA